MGTYRYKAFKDNRLLAGQISAIDLGDAVNIVKSISNQVVYVNKVHVSWGPSQSRVGEWFRELGMLMRQGIKIEDALEIIQTIQDEYMVSKNVLLMLWSGFDFITAMERNKFFFGEESILMAKCLYRCMKIEEICEFLYDYHSRGCSRQNKLRNLLLQPTIVLVFTVLIMGLIVTLLSEPMKSMANNNYEELPILIKLVDALDATNSIILVCIILITLYCLKYLILRLPWFKRYYLDRDLSVALKCMGQTLSNGVNIVDSIHAAQYSVKSKVCRNLMLQIKEQLFAGNHFYLSAEKAGLPSAYSRILKLHELTGNIASGCTSCAEVALGNLNKNFDAFSRLLGPSITLLTTTLVIVFINITLLPLYTFINNLNIS